MSLHEGLNLRESCGFNEQSKIIAFMRDRAVGYGVGGTHAPNFMVFKLFSNDLFTAQF